MTIVAATRNETYALPSMRRAVRNLLDGIPFQLHKMVHPSDQVLVKVNMGCSGARKPEDRFTTHPLFVQAIIEALQDCRAHVFFGDDVSRSGKHAEHIWRSTGMWDVANYTGARLVDFVTCGAKEVRGSLLYPRNYLISNIRFEADVTINAANCRSHAAIIMSGAIKNMFGLVVGRRKLLIHKLFRENIRSFARAIADIHRIVKADLSFLDITTFVAGCGCGEEIHKVGLILASPDPVAIDALAAQAVGYDDLRIWTTYWGNRLGIGCGDTQRIQVRGTEFRNILSLSLKKPSLLPETSAGNIYDRLTNFLNNTILRPRPVISSDKCTACGDCAERCPVHCIDLIPAGRFRIDLGRCVDCECCLAVCEQDAVSLQFRGLAREARRVTKEIALVTKCQAGLAVVQVIGMALLAVSVALMLINTVGLFLPLRSKLVSADKADLSAEHVLSSQEAFAKLHTLQTTDRERFALEASHIIGDGILHIEGDHLWPQDDPRFVAYHYTIPIWENWVLFLLRYVHPSTYLYYELCDWQRAINRGIGRCGQQSMALVGFLEEHGYRTGFVYLTSHTVATAETVPGRWIVLDPDYGISMPSTLEQLVANRALLETYYERHLVHRPWAFFTDRAPTVIYGGPEVRFPKACIIERISYVVKWVGPIGIGLLGLSGLRRKKFKANSIGSSS